MNAKYILAFLLGVSVVVFLTVYKEDIVPRTYLIKDFVETREPIGRENLSGLTCYRLNRPLDNIVCE